MTNLQMLKKGIILRFQDKRLQYLEGFIVVEKVTFDGTAIGLPQVYYFTRKGYQEALQELING